MACCDRTRCRAASKRSNHVATTPQTDLHDSNYSAKQRPPAAPNGLVIHTLYEEYFFFSGLFVFDLFEVFGRLDKEEEEGLPSDNPYSLSLYVLLYIPFSPSRYHQKAAVVPAVVHSLLVICYPRNLFTLSSPCLLSSNLSQRCCSE